MFALNDPAFSSVKSLERRSSLDNFEQSAPLLIIKVRISAALMCESEDGLAQIRGSLARASINTIISLFSHSNACYDFLAFRSAAFELDYFQLATFGTKIIISDGRNSYPR